MSEVRIAGQGLAALTCALLLARQGRAVQISGTGSTGARWLVLPQAAVELLCEVWGAAAGVLDGAWQVQHRCVRWGTATRRHVAARGATLDATALSHRLAAHLFDNHTGQVRFDDGGPGCATPAPTEGSSDARWRIIAAPLSDTALAGTAGLVTVGRRRIIAAEAPLAPTADPYTCLVETGRQGWTFLAPTGLGRALVQAMVPGPVGDPVRLLGHLLDETGLGALLAEPPAAAAVIPAAPGLLAPPCGPDWVAVGAAAVRFDPLSGSGAAQAVRTAILAAAAIDAIERGHSAQEVLGHYDARIRAAYTEHLRSCLSHYRAAFSGEAWQDEIDATTVVLRTIAAMGTMKGSPRRTEFVLSGLRLERQHV